VQFSYLIATADHIYKYKVVTPNAAYRIAHTHCRGGGSHRSGGRACWRQIGRHQRRGWLNARTHARTHTHNIYRFPAWYCLVGCPQKSPKKFGKTTEPLFSHSFPESPVVHVQWLCHFGHFDRSFYLLFCMSRTYKQHQRYHCVVCRLSMAYMHVLAHNYNDRELRSLGRHIGNVREN